MKTSWSTASDYRVVQARCLLVTNGLVHYCYVTGRGFIDQVPRYDEL